MIRSFILGALTATPLVYAAFPAAPQPAPQSGCSNVWVAEPLVVYDVTGATLAGLVDSNLVVYDSGVAKLSSASAQPGEGRAILSYVSPQEALDFARDLALAGGLAICDQNAAGSDVPLKTLTLFRSGKTDTRVHSFSWWFATKEYSAIQQRIDQFIQTHFSSF